MRFIIYGAGAIGGVMGSLLFEAGHETLLIARGTQLDAIRHHGLRLVTPTRSITQRLPVVGHPSEIRFRKGDVVFLTMKTYDTAAALHALSEVTDATKLPIVCAQNGVENERITARRCLRTYAMMVWMPSTFVEPGEVLCHGAPTNGLLDLGLYPSGVDDVAHAVASALQGSNISSLAMPDIMRWKYTKLLSNLKAAVNALDGAQADKDDFIARLNDEAIACYRAAGIDFASDAEASRRHDEAGVSITPIHDRPRAGSSLWQSLARQTGAVETECINGEIVLLGKLYGVDVPYNRAAVNCAHRMAKERLAPEALSMRDLDRMVDEQKSS